MGSFKGIVWNKNLRQIEPFTVYAKLWPYCYREVKYWKHYKMEITLLFCQISQQLQMKVHFGLVQIITLGGLVSHALLSFQTSCFSVIPLVANVVFTVNLATAMFSNCIVLQQIMAAIFSPVCDNHGRYDQWRAISHFENWERKPKPNITFILIAPVVLHTMMAREKRAVGRWRVMQNILFWLFQNPADCWETNGLEK